MLLNLTLPRILEPMTTALIDTVHAAEGSELALGAKLLDLTVDLSAGAAHDCPPISTYRIALRDRVWLRRMLVAADDEIEVGAPLALFSTEPDEPLDAAPSRAVRVSLVGIVQQPSWNGGLP